MSTRCFFIIWEVYAFLGLRSVQALHLIRKQGVHITPSQARYHLRKAMERIQDQADWLYLVHIPAEETT
jgi:hypothetical protein